MALTRLRRAFERTISTFAGDLPASGLPYVDRKKEEWEERLRPTEELV